MGLLQKLIEPRGSGNVREVGVAEVQWYCYRN